MNLYFSPPEELKINDEAYPIDTDFRTWIKFQSLVLNNESLKNSADLIGFIAGLGLPIFLYPKETLDAVIDFFVGGEKKINTTSRRSKKKAYDFETDSELIFSAFLTQYNINLSKDRMHWWIFKSLFLGLNDSHMISKVIWARTVDKSKLSKEQKEYVNRLNKSYPLNVNNSVHKMTLEERNQKWIDYINKRYEEIERK